MSTAAATISCGSTPSSAPNSPGHRLKFFCSHGGKILPRPADGQLKYVGGETRTISVPRDTPFQGTHALFLSLIDEEMILKFQLVSEDLDALVSVKSDEDLNHMFDEIERYEIVGSPRMRAFLFPVNHHLVIENQKEPIPPEQRYIYYINGITTKQLASLSPSPACSSPRSPDSSTGTPQSVLPNNCQNSNMHKIQSSPSMCHNLINISGGHYVQIHPQYYQNSGRIVAPESRLVSVKSVGRGGDGMRSPPQYYYPPGGSGCFPKCIRVDDCKGFSDGGTIDRQATLP